MLKSTLLLIARFKEQNEHSKTINKNFLSNDFLPLDMFKIIFWDVQQDDYIDQWKRYGRRSEAFPLGEEFKSYMRDIRMCCLAMRDDMFSSYIDASDEQLMIDSIKYGRIISDKSEKSLVFFNAAKELCKNHDNPIFWCNVPVNENFAGCQNVTKHFLDDKEKIAELGSICRAQYKYARELGDGPDEIIEKKKKIKVEEFDPGKESRQAIASNDMNKMKKVLSMHGHYRRIVPKHMLTKELIMASIEGGYTPNVSPAGDYGRRLWTEDRRIHGMFQDNVDQFLYYSKEFERQEIWRHLLRMDWKNIYEMNEYMKVNTEMEIIRYAAKQRFLQLNKNKNV